MAVYCITPDLRGLRFLLVCEQVIVRRPDDLCQRVRDYVIRYYRNGSRSIYSISAASLDGVRLPLVPLLCSHVPSSRLRTWKGPHSRRLPRPRPRLLRRCRLHLLSFLHCHNSGEHESHRRQITTIRQCHLVICLVHL